MAEQLPAQIDPLRLIRQGAVLRGTLPVAVFPRFCAELLSKEGTVEFELAFQQDGEVAAIKGRVRTEVELECQCCLERLHWPIDSTVALGVAASLEEANALPEPYEPLLFTGETLLPLQDIIEEEILLALPIIPQHGHCNAPARQRPAAAAPSPFAVLADLKKA